MGHTGPGRSKRWRRRRAIVGLGAALIAGVLVAVLVGGQPAAGESARTSVVPDGLFTALVKIDRKLTKLIDDVEAHGISFQGPATTGTSEQINQIQDMKVSMVDQFFTQPVYGVKFSDVFNGLDCLDSQLTAVQGRIAGTHGHITSEDDSASLAHIKAAKACKQKLEGELHTAGAAPDGLFTALVKLDRRLTKLIDDVEAHGISFQGPATTGTSEQIIQIHDMKVSMVDQFFTQPVYGVKFSDVFNGLDCLDSQLTAVQGRIAGTHGHITSEDDNASLAHIKAAKACKQKVEEEFHKATPPPGGCGVQQVGFNKLPAGSSSVVPQFAVAGPTSNDVLVGGENTDKVLAVNGSTGKLDAGVGSSGVLPLPSGFPSGATIAGLTFAGGTIYADFSYFANSTSNIAVVKWNGAGQLSSGFGSGGIATVTGDSSHQWYGGPLALAGGFLVLGGEESGSGGYGITPGAITFIPIDPTTGALPSSVASEPLPSGVQVIIQTQLLLGPDGNLYDGGAAVPTGGAPPSAFLGIFNPKTLAPVGQGTISDGDTSEGNYLSFLNGKVFLGVVSTTSSVNSTDIFSAPLGQTSGFTKLPVPLQIAGSDQAPAGLLPCGGEMLVGVSDTTKTSFHTFILPLSGTTFGTHLQIGDAGTQGRNLLPFGSGGIDIGTEWGGQNFSTYQTFFAPFK